MRVPIVVTYNLESRNLHSPPAAAAEWRNILRGFCSSCIYSTKTGTTT